MSWRWAPSGMANSSPMVDRAGAVMEEQRGERKAKPETMSDVAHFCPMDQFFGFAGSDGPSQVTSRSWNRNFAAVGLGGGEVTSHSVVDRDVVEGLEEALWATR